jgi:hypothetical protein
MNRLFDWFRDSGQAAFVASLLSFGAIVVSIVALRKSQKTQKRLVEIEEARERDRVAEKQKANLTARIDTEVLTSGTRRVTQYFLCIANEGAGEARAIKVKLDGVPLLKHQTTQPTVKQEIDHVGPKSSFRYKLFTADQLRPPSEIEISWEDDSGEPGKYKTSLTA